MHACHFLREWGKFKYYEINEGGGQRPTMHKRIAKTRDLGPASASAHFGLLKVPIRLMTIDSWKGRIALAHTDGHPSAPKKA